MESTNHPKWHEKQKNVNFVKYTSYRESISVVRSLIPEKDNQLNCKYFKVASCRFQFDRFGSFFRVGVFWFVGPQAVKEGSMSEKHFTPSISVFLQFKSVKTGAIELYVPCLL